MTDPAALGDAERIVRDVLDDVDRACSRFRADSELSRLSDTGGATSATVSPLLAELLAAALAAARRTGGDVDPTVGSALVACGYDRDLARLPTDAPALPAVTLRVPGWRRVTLSGRRLQLPPGVVLDFGATAKAVAADRAACRVTAACGVGVLVALGGDIATAGPGPAGGWQVLVSDGPGEPACTVALAAGAALATSRPRSRRWRRGGEWLHHILDPRTGLPAEPVWRTVSVAAATCWAANTAATAALVRGAAAPGLLRAHGSAARLVTADGGVRTLGGWPQEVPR